MIRLFAPGFLDIFYGLALGIVAVILLLTFAQWVRSYARHGIFSGAAAVLAGLFVAVQAAYWFSAGDVLESVEETPDFVESLTHTLVGAVDETVSRDGGRGIGTGADTVMSGIFDYLHQAGGLASEQIRSFRNHRLALGIVALLLGCCIVPLLMENGHGGMRRGASRRRAPREGRRRIR